MERALAPCCLVDAPTEAGSSIFCRFLEGSGFFRVCFAEPFTGLGGVCACSPLALCDLLRLSAVCVCVSWSGVVVAAFNVAWSFFQLELRLLLASEAIVQSAARHGGARVALCVVVVVAVAGTGGLVLASAAEKCMVRAAHFLDHCTYNIISLRPRLSTPTWTPQPPKKRQHGRRRSSTRAVPAAQPQGQKGLAQKRRRHADPGRPQRSAGADHPRVHTRFSPPSSPAPLLTAHSGVIAEKPSDELFAVDTTGSADIQKQVARRHKPLKADEILAHRSAVPAVASRKRLADLDSSGKRKKAKVSGKEYDRLRAIAYGGDQVQKDVVQTGDAAYDPWAVEPVTDDPRFSFLDKKKAKVEPPTLKRAPISMAKDGKIIPAVRKPAAGKSYNPDFQAWQELLTREADKAVEAEKKRLQEAREEAERMERAAAEPESDSGEESVWESEWEGFSDNENDNLKKKRPERKTPAQRNKIKRRKDAERLAAHEAKVKAKEQQVQKIKELAKSVAEKEKARATAKKILAEMDKSNEPLSDDDGEEEELRKKNLGKAP